MNIVKKNDKPINILLKEYINKNEEVKKGFARIDIEKIYKESMGPIVASYTEKVYLRGKKLYITITSAPLKAELQNSRDSLKNLLNEALEADIISEIIFR